jgi:3-oxoadipate enol-lactonase
LIRTERTNSAVALAISVAGGGPLVICVHGMGGDRTAWHAQLEALAPAYTAVAVDLRGYGDSAPSPGPLDFKADFSADLCAVMDHFGAERAHLVGLSMGGRVARTTALRYPDRVASLTLAHTSPGFDAMSDDGLRAFVAQRSHGLSPQGLPADFGLTQARKMMAPGTAPALLALAAAPMLRLNAAHYLEVLAASTLQDRGDRLEDIACPTLVIAGELDPVYPREVTAQLLARIPGARHFRIPGAGHLGNLEQPEIFNRALREFLDGLPPEMHAA